MRSALAGVSGVKEVLNVEVGSATVRVEPSVSKEQLRTALEKAGYGAKSVHEKK